MKKLLTIVAVALVLCLGISAAVAATYSGRINNKWELQDLLYNSESVYDIGTDTLKDISGIEPTYSQLNANKAAHHGYVNAKLTGVSESTGKIVTTEVKVQMTDHNDYLELDVAASSFNNCEEGGKLVYKCTYPGCTYTEEHEYKAVPHTFVEVDTATCTKAGKLYDKCSVCGYYAKDKVGNPVYKTDADGKVIETEALGHIYEGKAKYATTVACNPNTQRLAAGKVFQVCSRCGQNGKEVLDVTDKAYPTDTAKAEAIAEYIDKWDVPNGHNFEEKHYKDFTATCTKNGGYTVWCKNCGWMYDVLDSKQPALGHVWGLSTLTSCRDIHWNEEEPKANVAWECQRCGEYVDPDSESFENLYDRNGNYTGIKIVAEIDGKEYTASLTHSYKESGRTDYSVPNRFYEDSLSKINSDRYSAQDLIDWCQKGIKSTQVKCEICDREQWIDSKLGHDYDAWEVVNDKENVGTTTSRFQRECKRCGFLDVKVSTGVPCGDNEHDWIPVDKTKTACKSLNPGTAQICTKCGAKKTADFPIADHDWKEVAVVTAATCEKAGSHVMKCAWCGAIEEQEIAVIAHKLVKVEKVAATCKAVGTEEHYKCSACGKLFSDAEGKTEITKPAEIAIDENAHAWDEGKVTKEATTEAAGEKTYTCTICGKTKTEEIAKLVPEAKYSVTELAYNGQSVTGKVAHTEGTKEVEGLTIRVTFFLADNYYMATIGDIEADGTFSVDGVGPIEYISVVINGSSSVNPTDVVSYGSGEITVK